MVKTSELFLAISLNLGCARFPMSPHLLYYSRIKLFLSAGNPGVQRLIVGYRIVISTYAVFYNINNVKNISADTTHLLDLLSTSRRRQRTFPY